MMKILFISALLVSNLILSQEKSIEMDSFNITDDINILDEPRFYRNYFSEYNLNKNWFFRMEMQERSNDNYLINYTNIELPLLIKYKIGNKHSIFFGPNVNVLKIDGGIGSVSLFSTFGYQYNITEDFSVDARVDYNLMNKPTINIMNPTNTTNSAGDFVIYRVGAKLKF